MLGRILRPLRIGIFASRIANRLIDLGVDVQRIGPVCGPFLLEFERVKLDDLNPYEAAAQFFVVALPDLPIDSFINCEERLEAVGRAGRVIAEWTAGGRMRPGFGIALMRTIAS
jgi:hypothetical protein